MNLDPIVNFLSEVFKWLHGLTPNVSFGVTVIIFTVLLKLVLLPFNIIQTKSTVKTQLVQPKLKELQTKYKNDPKKLQQAQMELYKTEGVNPLGGCLPMLIQMPVLFAIFYVFRRPDIFAGPQASFLWVPDLAKADATYILPILSGISTYVSTLVLSPKTSEPNPMSSKSTNLIMSGVFLFMSLSIQAGLVLYWVVNNVLQLAIQYSLNKVLNKSVQTGAKK